MTYNIHSCVGIDSKIRPERIARVINHCRSGHRGRPGVDCHRFAAAGMTRPSISPTTLRMEHVFQAMFEEMDERYGIAIFSKYPMELIKAGNLTEAEPFRFREARGAIWVKVNKNGHGCFHFINTHFGLGERERNRQMLALAGPDWLGAVPPGEPVVLCGDFNAGPRPKSSTSWTASATPN
jgi:endonuclease/exonuclease/phosphatase family metal-dependent hydrolase